MSRKKPEQSGPMLPFDEATDAVEGIDVPSRAGASVGDPARVPTGELPDAEARARIIRDLDRSLLVEAGAGSGKTHELASRMAAGIASGAYQIDRMVAVTFTRKAAAELRGRFQLALENRLGASTPAEAGRIHAALARIERFFAGTIHAFCARLLRERPVEAGVAPGFLELDDAEDRMLRAQSWRDFRTQAMADGDEDLRLLDDVGVKPQQLDDAFRVVCLYEEVQFPTESTAPPDITQVWEQLEHFWEQLASRMPAPDVAEAKCELLAKAVEFRRRWQFARGRPRTAAATAELVGFWNSKTRATGKWWAPGVSKAEIEGLRDDFRMRVAEPFLTSWREYLYARVVTVLVKARARAADDRRRRNVLSFNDLLGRTASLLRTKPDVRRAMQRKYRWLFVDEFQDTDPLQAEIVFLLAADEEPRNDDDGGEADWRTARIRPGALFVVGDPKQSIYRFTRADIDIYNQVRALLARDGQGDVVSLTANFRSREQLCEWANGVFSRLFPDEATSQSPRYAPLSPANHPLADRDAAGRPALFTLTTADGRLVEEADAIARFIRHEVNHHRAAPGDFLILTRRKRPLQVYADALERYQLPVEVSGGSGFNQSEEVRQLALLLIALSDPQDRVALVGVLRGALFGVSDRQLFAWTEGGGSLGMFSRPGAVVSADAAPVGIALDAMRRWFRWTQVLPAGAALERILEDSGYLALAAADAGGVDAGDLLHAIDRVRALVQAGFSLFEAAEALAAWSELDDGGPDESTEVESLPLEPGRPDVIRLMNLHKAKGLEARTVILADPTGGFRPSVDVRIIRDPHSRGPAVGFFQIREPGKYGPTSGKPLAQPAGWAQHETDERAYLDAEETRLLYVAATRARERLVVCRAASGSKISAWTALDARVDGCPEVEVPASVEIIASDPAVLSAEAALRAERLSELAHGAVVRASWAATSVTAEAKHLPAATLAGEHDAEVDDPTRTMNEQTPSRRADAGMAWGALVHGLLEHAMRFPAATRDDLRRLAAWLTIDDPSVRVVIEQAIDTVEAVRTSQRLTAARAFEHHEEVPFAILESRDEAPRTVVTGAIDLVHRTPSGWRVIDYKTDVDEGALANRYAVQVEAYRQAWGKVVGGPVEKEIMHARQR